MNIKRNSIEDDTDVASKRLSISRAPVWEMGRLILRM